MAKARKILRRLRSVRNIHAVTRAMYMISTARFKQAHDRQAAAKPYLTGVMDMAAEALAAAGEGEELPPLMRPGPAGEATARLAAGAVGGTVAAGPSQEEETRGRDARQTQGRDALAAPNAAPMVLVVIASRRGLCGSYNNAVVDRAAERVRELRKAGREVLVGSSGKRGQLILEALGCGADRVFPQFDRTPEQASVRTMADGLMREFLGGEIAGVEVAYTQFISTGQQKPAIATLLPLAVGPSQQAASSPGARGPGAGDKAATRGEPVPPTYLPGRADVLGSLIPEAVRCRLFQCFLDASVSEHVARMTAMRYASENAEDLIHEMTVRYNRARQSQITMELSEIMGGREGVEGT